MAARVGRPPASASAGAFLLKVNREDCPNADGNPAEAIAWEDQKFISDMPRQTADKRPIPVYQTRMPRAGDKLLIWVNESRGGTGLTGMGLVDDCERQKGKLKIRVSGVSLFDKPRVDDTDLRRVPRRNGTALDDVNRNRLSSLRYLDASRFEEILEAAKTKSATLTPLSESEAEEGYQQDRADKFRQRNAQLIANCKRRDQNTCRACGFHLEVNGLSVIDCHHENPLGQERGARVTKLGELICLCPTCHRIAHTRKPPLRIEEIRRILRLK
jgi:hypothetical protein